MSAISSEVVGIKKSDSTPKRLKIDAVSTLLRPFSVPGRPSSTRKQLSRRATRNRVNYAENQENIDPEAPDESGKVQQIARTVDPDTVLRQKFSAPLLTKREELYVPPPSLGTRRKAVVVPRPLHDPCGEFAIVLYDPTIDELQDQSDESQSAVESVIKSEAETAVEQQPSPSTTQTPSKRVSLADLLGISNSVQKTYPKVPVVIDPKLSKVLRPHQIEGVKFLYRCATGMTQPDAHGCIMADEMGLGKTLQCIALMWTLLKQSPEGKKGTISKCVIVCPASLVRNWANELTKWLGKDAITPLAVDGKAVKSNEVSQALKQWALASGRQIVRPVLIISYEALRRNADELKNANIGLLLADEGHRLKNGESQTFMAIDALAVKRRVILSGTPIQNDLSEYFALLSFSIPGILGTRQEFRKNYELAILKGRDADATDREVTVGEQKLKDLSLLVSRFIIRRTNDILSKYLPVKYEHVVFCNLSEFQRKIYQHFVTTPEIRNLERGGVISQPLKAIDKLKKLCNHPDLLNLPEDIPGCENILPDDFVPKGSRGRDKEVKTWHSGKFTVLERMLSRIHRDTNDKIVLISNYTQTLDLIEQLCRTRRYGCLRLDGSMVINKRQKLVDQFNDPESDAFIFLLSSKAGGCGLNLVGANRLILMDPDWNPAADQQALARVWRDGQKKDCFVYRFISTGTIEEKIFQRQSMKQSLSSCVVDENEDVERLFSIDNLRQLFEFNSKSICDTHDTYKCKRCKDGKQTIRAPAMLYGDATTWNHFTLPEMKNIQDLLLRQETDFDVLSFVFQYISH
jgi:DNA repair and recombination RAD54-like protein